MKVYDICKNKKFEIFKTALLFLVSKGNDIEPDNWSNFSDLLGKAITLSEYEETDKKQNLLKMLSEIKKLGELKLNDDNAVTEYTEIINRYRRDIVDFCDQVYEKQIKPNEKLRAEYVRRSL